MNKIINVVLSGGFGTRLWPLSRQSKPKQFLKIFDIKSLFQHTIIEPVGRNTAPAIALAAMSVDQDDILFVTPSDHMVNDAEEYKKNIKRAITLANKGFFDSLISYFNKNNIVEGISKIKGIDNLNSYSIGKKEVYGIGVSDLTVVDTQDCILVLPNQYGNRIKELHSNVKERLL
jgi:mannose-1-phosphate guanylyltransferase